MNERIKELAVRATQKFSRFEERDSWEKLFAELVVRECADVLDKQIAPPNHPMNSLGYKLKQRFGVEE